MPKKPVNWFKVSANINTLIMHIAERVVDKDEGDEVINLLRQAKIKALDLERKRNEHTG